MGFHITNLAHRSPVILSRSSKIVIADPNNENSKQKWTFELGAVFNGLTDATEPVRVGIQKPDNRVSGGGLPNNFRVIPVVIGSDVHHKIMITVEGVDLYWTLEDGKNGTPVTVKPLAGDSDANLNAQAQVWVLTPV